MKRLRVVLAGLAAFVLAFALLVWFMPARWVLPWLRSSLHGVQFEQLEGTLWNGRAGQVSMADGTRLGRVAWTLSHRALIGDIQLGLKLQQPQLQVQGWMHRISATQQAWRDVTLHLDMAMLGVQPWLHGQPQGQFDLHIPHAQWQGDWPMQLDAQGSWSQAAVDTGQGPVRLGVLRLAIMGQSGVLHATLDDDGHGPLRTAGRLSFSPLGWDLRLDLKPRSDDPALLRWLHGLGTPAADGTLELRYRGGLAQFGTGKA
ncbi:type II secretion system protein N [Dyella jejuensis]|uniref:Type II secretion system protein N n=1 Tax=Dyella jejuensis TaxID=1432009 RepID=A0ABW8JHL0_9GAMM